MLEFSIKFFTFIDIALALFIIGLVLVQQSKGGGLGGLAGGATEEVFGAGTGSLLTRLTVVCSVSFLVVTLGLGILQGKANRHDQTSVIDDELNIQRVEEPAKKAKAKPAAAATSGQAATSEKASPAGAAAEAPASPSAAVKAVAEKAVPTK